MKVYFFTSNDVDGWYGGGMASKRNFECLKDIYGAESVSLVKIMQYPRDGFMNNVTCFLDKIIKGREYPSLQKQGVKPSKGDLLFFDSSTFGSLLQEGKDMGCKTAVFFHNCETEYKAIFFGDHPSIRARYYLSRIRKSEKLFLSMADACIFINDRDRVRLEKMCGIKPRKYAVAGMTMNDKMSWTPEEVNEITHNKPVYTVLGSYFKPNVDGIKWFVKNVFPYVDITLRIIGRDMNKLKNDIDCTGLEIYSNVPDLTPYMKDSDYMLYPIFEGSGTKVKTCEALMYGKNIVGTPEAFSGYGLEDFSKVGACCETAKEMIAVIKSLSMPRHNAYNRQYFLDNFSYEKSLHTFREILL